MKLTTPAVRAVNSVYRIGTVQQLLQPSRCVEGSSVKFTVNKYVGLKFSPGDGDPDIYLFRKSPVGATFPDSARVLVGKFEEADAELDLSEAHWFKHELLAHDKAIALAPSALADAARTSWFGAFHYAEENIPDGVVGLRKPQLGALHAIHAHWSISTDIATVVMPTGTGKTETMLSTLISTGCLRVFVIVPTDALRTQIAGKFATLGLLKVAENRILDEAAHRPVVGVLTSKPKTAEEVQDFLQRCNVVVTTAHLVGGCDESIRAELAKHCTHLFIDEAHHSEAKTWKEFRDHFIGKPVLQFTATPFREDNQPVDGKLIYVYPLRKAQEEGYFRPIRFHEVYEFDAAKGDREIALAAIAELDADTTGKHLVMARVGGVDRAGSVLVVYQSLGRYEAVVIHSRLKLKERDAAKAKLFAGAARIVICVDMLGEGFDLPELKIAAFHDIRKSLAVTLQLAGRFTRVRHDLGNPVFIANTALIDVREELQKLYSQDPDWNSLLPNLTEEAIADEVTSQEFLSGFQPFLDELPLKDLRPAASMVVYRTQCANWHPDRFRKGFKGLTDRDKLYHTLNERENTLVVVAATEQCVRWSEVESLKEWRWELFVAVWDREHQLLYLHGANNSSEYKELAKSLCGDDVSIVVEPKVYRCFHGVNRLVMNNVGLDEHLGRQIRYTGRMGSDVESRLSEATRQGTKRAVLAGKGYERGEKASVGAAKRGRVWSSQRLRVDTFASWCRAIGAKLVDESIDPDEVLSGTLKPIAVGVVPHKVAIAADWPSLILDRPEAATIIKSQTGKEFPLTELDIEVMPRADDAPLILRVFSEDWEAKVRLNLFAAGDSFDYSFAFESGSWAQVGRSSNSLLTEFLTEQAPTIWFADGSSLEGCHYVELPPISTQPYARERLRVLDWTGINLRKESQGIARASDTIQFRLIETLKADPSYSLIFDDDGAGEAADVVAVRLHDVPGKKRIEVEFYHCKYAVEDFPGARVDDLYVVCGQSQKSICWLGNRDRRTDLFVHLLKREAKRVDHGKPSRFEVGDKRLLAELREASRRCEVSLNVFAVQPGMSKAGASHSQLALLAVTERYLTETYQVPFAVICSE
ncbi:DEAD/DEAH box helicase [Derxia lacustris]|uniref:DEAD/DEAH box helicase n=1 Tax=Derxia lacustris TaxID=764842 RepID=UPI000A16E1C0|nr:DEAD/DEAH box helicase family protein [Derxia lacustris]